MIGALDRFGFAIWHVPLKFLCKVTGRSNFFFARVAWCFALIFVGLWAYVARDVLSIALLGIWLLMTFSRLRMITDAEEAAEATSEVIELHAEGVFHRLLGMFLALYIGIPAALTTSPDYFFNIAGWLCWSASFYFQEDIQPRSKSPLKRAVEWLAAHPIRLPSFNPAPQPG